MTLLDKIWNTKVIFRETVLFTKNAEGDLVGGTLLFAPTEIVSFTSWDGETVYEEGRDYILDGRQIIRTADSRIPFLPRENYCLPFDEREEHKWLRLHGGREYFAIYPEVYGWQCLISYRHNNEWTGFIPQNMADHLPRTMEILRSGRELNLVFYGDSITAGWEASGCDEHATNLACEEFHLVLDRYPHMPAWPELVTRTMREAFPNAKINKFNRSAGAATTGWGVNNAQKLVDPCKPDLAVVAFGMNSLQDDPKKYRAEIEQILANIRANNPDCEFILVSPMVATEEIAGLANNKLPAQEAELLDLAKAVGIACAPVNSVFRAILAAGKPYVDLTGNCINHPNDFSVRVYAQTVLSALGL